MVSAPPIQTQGHPSRPLSRQSRRVSSRDQGLQYDGDNAIADLTDGNISKFYVTPFLDQNVSMTVIGGPDAGIYYYSQDGLGSVRTLTNSSGNLVNHYDHDAFGVPLAQASSETVKQRYTYTGREASGVNGGPMYYRFRMYDYELGRFGRRDPAGYENNEFGNLYEYVASDAVNETDSMGLGDGKIAEEFVKNGYRFVRYAGDTMHGGRHWHIYKGRALIGRVAQNGRVLTGKVSNRALNILTRRLAQRGAVNINAMVEIPKAIGRGAQAFGRSAVSGGAASTVIGTGLVAGGAYMTYYLTTERLKYEQMAREIQWDIDNNNAVIAAAEMYGRAQAKDLLRQFEGSNMSLVCPFGFKCGWKNKLPECKENFRNEVELAYAHGASLAFALLESGRISAGEYDDARGSMIATRMLKAGQNLDKCLMDKVCCSAKEWEKSK